MKKLLLFALLTLSFASIARGQTPNGVRSQTFVVPGTSTPINLINTAIAYHKLTWNVVNGTSSACSVQLDGSANGTTFGAGDVIPAQTCTTNGSSVVVNMIVNYVRIDMTAITVSAGASVVVTWDGWIVNPAGGSTGTVTSVSGTGPIVATPNPITGAGTISCPTCVTAAGGGSISGTTGQIAVFTATNVVGGSASLTSPASGQINQILVAGAATARSLTHTGAATQLYTETLNTDYLYDYTANGVAHAQIYMIGGGVDPGDIELFSFSATNPGSFIDTDIDGLGTIAFTSAANRNVVMTPNGTGGYIGPLYKTTFNCLGSTSNPINCNVGAIPGAAGATAIAAGATTTTVATSAVGADSEIFVSFAPYLSTRLSLTCNTTVALPTVTSIVAGTSFTFTIPVAPITNPGCFIFWIVNR